MRGAAAAGPGGALRRLAGDADRDPDPARPRDAARVPNAMMCADAPWRDSARLALWASGMLAQNHTVTGEVVDDCLV
eukprot:SAG31_NODE_477_length_15150_cov_13.611772_5_plen_77_part_00